MLLNCAVQSWLIQLLPYELLSQEPTFLIR